MPVTQIDRCHAILDADPIGQHAFGIGALAFALYGDRDVARPVVARDMGLVRPEVRQEDRRIVEARTLGKGCDVEADRGIDEIGDDRCGNR